MTIDTNELRRLAQAATPGPWWVNQGGLNHGFDRGVVEINAKEWHALAGAWAVNGAKPSEEGAANAEFIAAANPAVINELLDRLEAAEKERDALRARIEALERQEPVAFALYSGWARKAVYFSEIEACDQRDRRQLTADLGGSLEAYRVVPLIRAHGAKGE